MSLHINDASFIELVHQYQKRIGAGSEDLAIKEALIRGMAALDDEALIVEIFALNAPPYKL